jgi:hypothetical protein
MHIFGHKDLFVAAAEASLGLMKTRTGLLMAALLALPALVFAQEQKAAPPGPALAQPAQSRPTFDLKASGVRDAIRANAVSDAPPKENEAPTTRTDLPPLQFRAPRRVHRVECDSFNCVAYTADDDALFSIPRDQYFGVTENGSGRDAWLSCQSGNDLLTTFERYDKCRGVSIGIPVQFQDVQLNVPVLSR